MMLRECVKNPDDFCYICNQLNGKSQCHSLIPVVKNCYCSYFGFPLLNLDETWQRYQLLRHLLTRNLN